MEDARKRIWMVDTDGLVTTERCHELPEHKKAYARNDGTPDMKVNFVPGELGGGWWWWGEGAGGQYRRKSRGRANICQHYYLAA